MVDIYYKDGMIIRNCHNYEVGTFIKKEKNLILKIVADDANFQKNIDKLLHREDQKTNEKNH